MIIYETRTRGRRFRYALYPDLLQVRQIFQPTLMSRSISRINAPSNLLLETLKLHRLQSSFQERSRCIIVRGGTRVDNIFNS